MTSGIGHGGAWLEQLGARRNHNKLVWTFLYSRKIVNSPKKLKKIGCYRAE
jgi:hypothetical protein